MNKKELINDYKNRVQTGGIFAIKNNLLNKWFLDCTSDLNSAKNRFEFMGNSFMKIAKDYNAQRGEGFVFEVLEELQKTETQTQKEFSKDLKILKTMWLEKLQDQDFY